MTLLNPNNGSFELQCNGCKTAVIESTVELLMSQASAHRWSVENTEVGVLHFCMSCAKQHELAIRITSPIKSTPLVYDQMSSLQSALADRFNRPQAIEFDFDSDDEEEADV